MWMWTKSSHYCRAQTVSVHTQTTIIRNQWKLSIPSRSMSGQCFPWHQNWRRSILNHTGEPRAFSRLKRSRAQCLSRIMPARTTVSWTCQHGGTIMIKSWGPKKNRSELCPSFLLKLSSIRVNDSISPYFSKNLIKFLQSSFLKVSLQLNRRAFRT